MTDDVASPVTFGLLLFDEVEVLDACGPFEVFTVAGELARTGDGRPLLRVITIAGSAAPVVASGGLRIVPDHSIHDDPVFDVLVVPGGELAAIERVDEATVRWLAARHESARVTLSVCTGAFLLAQAGVLDGRPATTHWAAEEELASRWPAVRVAREPRWVDDGDVVTAAGISAGIDASLHVVRRMFGADLAERTARLMEYDWRDAP